MLINAWPRRTTHCQCITEWCGLLLLWMVCQFDLKIMSAWNVPNCTVAGWIAPDWNTTDQNRSNQTIHCNAILGHSGPDWTGWGHLNASSTKPDQIGLVCSNLTYFVSLMARAYHIDSFCNIEDRSVSHWLRLGQPSISMRWAQFTSNRVRDT